MDGVTALTHWRQRRDSHTREIVKHETREELPAEVRALLIAMAQQIEDLRARQTTTTAHVDRIRGSLDALRQAALTGGD